uniref:Reverse transcriptase domain-containing protein n=1 Tax=Ditylenchus dipsaci TaxID=166011 RepID=A0A915DVK1_9BILA
MRFGSRGNTDGHSWNTPEEADGKDISIDQLSDRLQMKGLQTLQSMSSVQSGKTVILASNATNAPILIPKGMTIAMAKKISYRNKRWTEKLSETDPTYKIDFTKSVVCGQNLESLVKLVDEFASVFSKHPHDIGSCTVGEHKILTTDQIPVQSKATRQPVKMNDAVEEAIQKMVECGVVVESDTPWVSIFVLVEKKRWHLRPCIDFRKLNEKTIFDPYPLPRIEMILSKIGGCTYYSTLDLASGYWQIRLHPDASRKCGIVTPTKVYQMTHLPFGLKNATSAFGRTMALVLSGLEEMVVVYVDDLLVYTKSPDFQEHLKALRCIFERFRKFNLKISPKKCVLATDTIHFLGHKIRPDGYVRLRSGLKELAILYENISPDMRLLQPLNELTRKGVDFKWEQAQQEAFDTLKKAITSEPVLAFPNYEKPFHVFTDASQVGQGAALMQLGGADNKTHQVIAYVSRTLSVSERKWPAVQIELSAIIFALREFKPFIYLSQVEIHCDHKPLIFLLRSLKSIVC